MKYLIIKDRKRYIHHKLSEEASFEYEGISIYFKNGTYYLLCKDGFQLQSGDKITALKDERYIIESTSSFDTLELFVYRDGQGVDAYAFYENRDLMISSLKESDIKILDPYLKEGEFLLHNGCIDSDLEFSVNEKGYDGLSLKDGDLIEILGIRIYYYETFLYINSFQIENHLPLFEVKAFKPKYKRKTYRKLYCLKQEPVTLSLAKLKAYEPYEKRNNEQILKSILPSFVMSFSIILISSIGLYRNIEQGKGILDSLTYIISPLAMLISGVVLPVLFYRSENKREEQKSKEAETAYKDYLETYKKDVLSAIESYVKGKEGSYFSLGQLENRPFYLKKGDEDYFHLCLGRSYGSYVLEKEKESLIVFEEERQIKDILSHIGPLPLLLDLNKNRNVTIVSKQSERDYFFHRFLLETAYKHSYEDLAIAVYARDKAAITSFYDLPHLFLGERRLFFTDERSLQELDQIKTERPVLLFCKDSCSVSFRNDMIHRISFVNEIDEADKGSDVIVEYLTNNGVLYKEGRRVFSYVKDVSDMDKRFHELGMYNERFRRKEDRSFLNLFEHFDIEESYRSSHHDLRCDFAWNEDQLLCFDLHEDKQGPHGLIGGSTGSGKSELIISMLLSLCIRYSPDYLNIVLIDYKGSQIEQSLSFQGRRLPHIIASVSNLEENFERLIIQLKNICLERQRIFKTASQRCLYSIGDIDQYLDCDLQSFGLEKMAHLLILVDEFAELRKEHPEYIRELISISRIGRSLGIHLILSTQKPSGNIDEEIWSNSRFKICLKVQEEKDSLDLIKSREAAYLTAPGQFYLKVDESLQKGTSIYAGSDAKGSEPYEIDLLDEKLQIEKRSRKVIGRGLSQSSYFTGKILEICEKLSLKEKKLKIFAPAPMERQKLAKGPCFVLGEIDDYIKGENGLLAYSLKEDLLICTHRRNEINALINTLNENKRPFIHIGKQRLDMGSCKDSFLYEESDDILFIFEYLMKTEEKVSLLIEDLNIFLFYEEVYRDLLMKVLKQKKENVSLICLSSSAEIGYKLIGCFKNKVLIDTSDPSEISYLFAARSLYKGKNFFCKEEVLPFIAVKSEVINKSENACPSLIKRIPVHLKAAVKEDSILLGMELNTRKEVFASKDLIIASYKKEDAKIYEEAYGLKICDPKELKALPEAFLWVGSGVFMQRLFYADLKEDLKDNEGIFILQGRKMLLRCIDHA